MPALMLEVSKTDYKATYYGKVRVGWFPDILPRHIVVNPRVGCFLADHPRRCRTSSVR